ncbi:outer membrane lipoprotein chaperone LolA [Polaromonas sp.]|uniref:outer membrane lipoprotein chaperone LolA n=1 Tax=Polaromonas sp. TaxID=1869339 RepID=UPI0024898494|nr:outer membrane lipoprotein chaperone LolA [Polaromonas sp.]MDI1274062.1 outer membrane lipoprotein chaperone LolA [Polaromonas sp.]
MIHSLPFPALAARRPLGGAFRAASAAFLAVFAIAASAQVNTANGLESLEAFVKNTKSGRAVFTQVVTSPAREGQTAKTKTSSGSFEFLRPNRFKFVYKKPFEQSIVSDGQTLWLHDVDLNQVTARKLTQVLGGTPAAVIAAAADIKALQADFTLVPQPDRAGLEWVQASPRTRDGQVQSITVGFRNTGKGSELAVLEILDSFGQRSVMTFTQFEVNPALGASVFEFKPPAGADVIRQ